MGREGGTGRAGAEGIIPHRLIAGDPPIGIDGGGKCLFSLLHLDIALQLLEQIDVFSIIKNRLLLYPFIMVLRRDKQISQGQLGGPFHGNHPGRL